MTMGVEILVILLLVLLNGFFAMSELAIVSSRKARLKVLADDGNRGQLAHSILWRIQGVFSRRFRSALPWWVS